MSNEKIYKLGQQVGEARANLAALRAKVSSESEHASAIAAAVKAAEHVLIQKEKELARLAAARPVVKKDKKYNVGGIVDESPEYGLKDGGPVSKFDPKQIGLGINEEFEHTKDANEALKIAVDHLKENPEYYTKLKKAKLEDGGTVLGEAVVNAGMRPKSIDDEMSELRKKYPEYKEVPDSVLVKSLMQSRKEKREAAAKADGGGFFKHEEEPSNKLTDEEKLSAAEERAALRESFKNRPIDPSIGTNAIARSSSEPVDRDIDYSEMPGFKKELKSEKESIKNYKKLKRGGLVDGAEDEYAGDKVDAKLNKNELVLNVEQQQKLLDLINGRNTELPKHDRVDNLINKDKLDIDERTQKHLFDFIKGEIAEPPRGSIIKPKLEEGGMPDIMDTALQEPQQVPMQPNAAQPILSEDPTPLPQSMKYTGVGANKQGTLPENKEAPVDATGIIPTKADTTLLNAAKTEAAAKAEMAAAFSVGQAAATKVHAIKQVNDMEDAQRAAQAKNLSMVQLSAKLMNDEDSKEQTKHESTMGKYFASASMPEKILMGAALAISAPISIISGKSPVLDYIENSVRTDLDQQKLDQDTKLAKKKYYLDLYKTAIEKQAVDSNSQLAKQHGQLAIAQISEIQQKIDMQRQQLKMAQAQMQMQGAAMAGGVNEQSVKMLPKEVQETAVKKPDGSVGFAFDKERAQKLTEYTSEVGPAIEGAKRILEVSRDLNRVTDLNKRAAIASEMKALAGSLRLPFTGPGVLTDSEYTRLMDTIGDPNLLVALPELQRTKLNTVLNKLQKDMKLHYRNAGVPVEDTLNEKNIEKLKKQNKGMGDWDAEQFLRKSGYWKE